MLGEETLCVAQLRLAQPQGNVTIYLSPLCVQHQGAHMIAPGLVVSCAVTSTAGVGSMRSTKISSQHEPHHFLYKSTLLCGAGWGHGVSYMYNQHVTAMGSNRRYYNA